ncbi:MAG: glutamate 5-kinase [Verrucomicrobia bacterium]|nr:glutamate 5-kinase [Verrucomicrobiota bacterium]MCH8510181.1 glutamate 5-kinase [Kiritimatiellia bacterium]
MTAFLHRERLKTARRVVVKFGTRVLVDSRGRPNPARIQAIVDQVSALHAEGREVVIVSSGAVGAGLDPLKFKTRPTGLAELQMAAAVGQTRLMSMYGERFAKKGIAVGQILLNHDDLKQRTRHLNARNTLMGLLHHGVVPIVNENDVVSVDEIRLGDNDFLAALVTVLVDADALLLCTSVNGLRAPSGEGRSKRVPFLSKITQTELDLVFGKGSALSTGGMGTKLEAARMAYRAGIPAVICDGRKSDTLLRVMRGEDTGTLLGPAGDEERIRGKRKHWIAFFHRPVGVVVVDAGARGALVEKGRSLLPAGVLEVRGSFPTGTLVHVLDESGETLAAGLCEFDDNDLRKIQGKSSSAITEILGPAVSTEVIHRDNMAILLEPE